MSTAKSPKNSKRPREPSVSRQASSSVQVEHDLIKPDNFEDSEVSTALTDRAAVLPIPAELAGFGYDQLGGIESITQEFQASVYLLIRGRQFFAELGVASSKHFLIHGPSGVGKTSIGHASMSFASSYPDLRIAFFELKGEELTATHLSKLFHSAKLLQPSIVFIDNLDRLFNDESLEMSLNCELDSMESKHTVFVLAMATSVRTVKQTFLTPWRFSRKMEISLPDLQARLDIFRKVMSGWPGVTDAIVSTWAGKTSRWTGADIKAFCNCAAVAATRRSNPHLILPGIAADASSTRQVQLTPEDFDFALANRA